MATIPTLREQVDSFLSIAGADTFGEAQTQIQSWRALAKGEGAPSKADYDHLNQQLAEICKAAEAPAPEEVVTSITGIKNSITKLWTTLGVKDEESAISAIKTFKSDNAKFQKEIETLKSEKEDFEKRVNAEVISRAASAGIQIPVKKPAASSGGEGAANMMTRAEFNLLSPAQATEFSKNGGKLSD